MTSILTGWFGITSITTMSAIALDRYLAIAKPFQIIPMINLKRIVLILLITWLYPICWVMLPVFGWGNFVLNALQTSCTFDYLTRDNEQRSYLITLIVGGFLTPFSIILFSYFGTFWEVHLHEKDIRTVIRKNTNHGRYDIRLAKIGVYTVLLFVSAWLPYVIVTCIGSFGDVNLITPTVSIIPEVFAKSSGSCNFFLYCVTNVKFRKATCDILTGRRNSVIWRSDGHRDSNMSQSMQLVRMPSRSTTHSK